MSESKPEKNRVIIATASEARPTLHKAREVIYTYPKKGKITLVMRKAFNRMLQNAHQQGIDVEWYRLPIRRLANNIDYDSNDMKALVSTVEAMQTTLIRWGEIDEKGRTTLNSVQLIGAVKFVGELRSDGRRLQTDLLYKFDDGVKERVFNSSSRALLNLDLQNQFKSSYTAALYEQLMEVVAAVEIDDDGWWRSSRLPWQEWRDLIMSADTSAYYDNIKYFNRDVLRKALAELEAFLDEYEVVAVLEKEGREYKHLSFQIRLRAQSALPLDHSVPLIDTSRAEKAMAEFGMNEVEIQEVLEAKDLEEIEGAIAYTRRRMEKPGAEKLTKPAAYFISALAGKYSERAGSIAAKLKKPSRSDKAPTSGSGSSRTPSESDITLRVQIKEGQTYFSSLDPGVQQQKLEEWVRHEANTYQKSMFAKDGLKSTSVTNGFFTWLARAAGAP
jgi:hypothetical protein